MRFTWRIGVAAVAGAFLWTASPRAAEPAAFRAGAAMVDISPTNFPVIVNAMFTERTATKVIDPLHVRAIVLDDGTNRLAFAVVDTCMMPRELIDKAKAEARGATSIPLEHMLVSATHTHSAPAAMGCLGSRADTNYAAFLPGKITEAIVKANARLEPARIGWTVIDDWDHTFNRRWIRRPDRMFEDPFGFQTVRAHMHPGHESKDVAGPSGTVDPALSILSIQKRDGRPLALLANYSQHYYESELLSSDYYGRFAKHLAELLGAKDADGEFVGCMSQGTSGDLMWMDYGAPQRKIGYDAYAREIAERVHKAAGEIRFQDWVPLRAAVRKLELNYRVPDEARLERARKVVAELKGRLPQNLPEVYAWESIYLNERQRTELVLQAVRIGDLGIAALPNEVFALTGLKLKAQSPLQPLVNIELANGAEGYIPPPEQHALGGYTTWAARTAGLEVQAEPQIVATLLSLLEEVSGKPRGSRKTEHGPYAHAVLASGPTAYWRFEEMVFPRMADASPNAQMAELEPGVALFLPGPGSGDGISPNPSLTPSNFSGPSQINRAIHLAGGRVKAAMPVNGESYVTEFWFWNGLPNDARPVTGVLFWLGRDLNNAASGESLAIGGTEDAAATGRLIFTSEAAAGSKLVGGSVIPTRRWQHVAVVRSGELATIYLNGKPEAEGKLGMLKRSANRVLLGGRPDNVANFEGKLDEAAVYDRPLTAEEIGQHYAEAGVPQ